MRGGVSGLLMVVGLRGWFGKGRVYSPRRENGSVEENSFGIIEARFFSAWLFL